jgi:hypothetical protein
MNNKKHFISYLNKFYNFKKDRLVLNKIYKLNNNSYCFLTNYEIINYHYSEQNKELDEFIIVLNVITDHTKLIILTKSIDQNGIDCGYNYNIRYIDNKGKKYISNTSISDTSFDDLGNKYLDKINDFCKYFSCKAIETLVNKRILDIGNQKPENYYFKLMINLS